MTSHRTIRARWKAMLFTVLAGALMIILLLGCASDPTSTPVDLTPPVATSADADTSGSDSTVEPTQTLGTTASTPEVTPPSASTPTDTTAESPSQAATPSLLEFVAADTRHFMGDPNAPVTVIEFGDFQ